jgi:pimeloyl-ACP methyl ester carboxylesterase
MPIVSQVGPNDGPAVVGYAAQNLLFKGPTGLLPPPLGGAAPQTNASKPVQLFSLGLNDINDAGFLKSARPEGWRYLVVSGVPLAIADVRDTKTGTATFSALTRGPVVERFVEATNFAEKHYHASPDHYEVRALEIPSLYVSALWLHGARDIFIPYLEGGRNNAPAVQEDPTFTTRILQAAAEKRAVIASTARP